MSGGQVSEFSLEVFFAKYEFTAKYLLCCSDAESFSMKDILALADEETQDLWDNLQLCYTGECVYIYICIYLPLQSP